MVLSHVMYVLIEIDKSLFYFPNMVLPKNNITQFT